MLGPTPTAASEADKEFYVSPFLAVDGRYRMPSPEPGERLSRCRSCCTRAAERVFAASLMAAGARSRHASVRVGMLLRHPWMTLKVMALIRLQGIRLLLRGASGSAPPTRARARG